MPAILPEVRKMLPIRHRSNRMKAEEAETRIAEEQPEMKKKRGRTIMTAKSKAEKKKSYIRIGALIIAAIMTLSVVLAIIIR